MKTIIHIVGNRPQFIKLAMLYRELEKHSIPQKIIHTGQHSDLDMSDIFFKELVIPDPHHNLSIIQPTAGAFFGEAADKLQQALLDTPNSIAFVYGDTNTTLAGAFAAKRADRLLFHFEGGVRTGDHGMPEEINRILTDRLADVNYCCTTSNRDNLLAEGHNGFLQTRVVLTGDLMLDAFRSIQSPVAKIVNVAHYIACTIHRAGNILSRNNLTSIIEGLNQIHSSIPVVMPMHPHTRKRIREFGIQTDFILLPPLGYPAMKNLVEHSEYVITDSGGAAREAFFAGKKSIVVMEKPFWPEIIAAGCAINVSPTATSIFRAFESISALKGNFQSPIFGRGDAARIIAEDLFPFFS